jgi:hypothetical protein
LAPTNESKEYDSRYYARPLRRFFPVQVLPSTGVTPLAGIWGIATIFILILG